MGGDGANVEDAGSLILTQKVTFRVKYSSFSFVHFDSIFADFLTVFAVIFMRDENGSVDDAGNEFLMELARENLVVLRVFFGPLFLKHSF